MWLAVQTVVPLTTLLAHSLYSCNTCLKGLGICLEGWVTLQNADEKTGMFAGVRGSLNCSLTAGSGSDEGARRVQIQPRQASCSHREECSLIWQPHRVSPGGMRMPASK